MTPVILFLFSVLLNMNSNTNTNKNHFNHATFNTRQIEVKDPPALLRHVVLFNFNEKASEEIVKKIEQEFTNLSNKIKEIHAFEWGTNNSPEGLDKGFTHCFLVTFLSEDARAKYLPHHAHQEFVKLIGPYVKDVTVVDYWVK